MPSVVALSIIVLGSFILSIVLVVVCGKRKLSQRKECSRRDPHVPGMEAGKTMRREIDRRLDRVSDIYYEPRLISFESDNTSRGSMPPFYYRMKAVDNMKYLEEQITSLDGVTSRTPRESIRAFLMNLTNTGSVLSNVEPRILHELCDHYEHARHHPFTFGAEQFSMYHSILVKILQCARSRGKICPGLAGLSSGKTPSENDSAIDEPDHPDDEIIISQHMIGLVHRPSTLKVTNEDNFETPV